MEESEPEWKVDRIVDHRGRGKHAMFEILWSSGDKTWFSHAEAEHLPALEDYFELLGITKASQL